MKQATGQLVTDAAPLPPSGLPLHSTLVDDNAPLSYHCHNTAQSAVSCSAVSAGGGIHQEGKGAELGRIAAVAADQVGERVLHS